MGGVFMQYVKVITMFINVLDNSKNAHYRQAPERHKTKTLG
jgi:hypothetical protein